MKKRFLCIFLVVICLFITACGAGGLSKTPYLSKAERNAFVKDLMASIKITEKDGSCIMSITNNSKYDVWDLQIIDSNTNLSVCYLPVCPKGATYTNGFGSVEDVEEDLSHDYELYFTIGDFFYTIPDIELPPLSEGEAADSSLKIYVETKQGRIPLTTEKTNFEDYDIYGLSNASITAISISNSTEIGGLYTPFIYIDGRAPSGGRSVVYKFVDENDVIWSAGQIISMNSTWEDEYVFAFNIEPGTYTLMFDERS